MSNNPYKYYPKSKTSFTCVGQNVVSSLESSRKTKSTKTNSKKVVSENKPIVFDKPRLHLDQNEMNNIIYIDSVVKEHLEKQITSLPDIERELTKFIWITLNGELADQALAQKQVSFLKKRIDDLNRGMDLSMYILKTNDLIEEYKSIKCKIFFLKMQQTEEDRIKEKRKQEIVRTYLSIARDYVNIECKVQSSVPISVTHEIICTNPDCKQKAFEIIEEQNICMNCGQVNELLDISPKYKDTDRVNMCEPYHYSRRGHMKAAIDKYQGKQNTTIPDKVYEILRQNIRDHNLDINTVSKDVVYQFLAENKAEKLNDYYEDINLIYHNLTGNPLPDISDHEQILLELSDQYDEVYDQLKGERIHAHNVNHKLYKLLKMIGCDCKKSDFYFLKTKERQDEHDDMWERCVLKLIDKYPDGKWCIY